MRRKRGFVFTRIILWRSLASGTSPLHSRITVPVVSNPLRPALPAIWTYSPRLTDGWNFTKCIHNMWLVSDSVYRPMSTLAEHHPRKRLNFLLKCVLEAILLPAYIPGRRSLVFTPSCFLVESNTTVLAGIFTPMANVSVANSSCIEEGLKTQSDASLW